MGDLGEVAPFGEVGEPSVREKLERGGVVRIEGEESVEGLVLGLEGVGTSPGGLNFILVVFPELELELVPAKVDS